METIHMNRCQILVKFNERLSPVLFELGHCRLVIYSRFRIVDKLSYKEGGQCNRLLASVVCPKACHYLNDYIHAPLHFIE